MPEANRGTIRVLAGPNGAGKSSVAGAHLRASGTNYFNPDEIARELLRTGAVASISEANSQAWNREVAELRRAIEDGTDFTFEATLGGRTISGLLLEAAERGLEVHVWYVALSSADLHIQRVQERVASGGHDIPVEQIRKRYDASRSNLVRLLPRLTSLHLYDNSAPPDAETGIVVPRPLLVLEVGRIVEIAPDPEIPEWATPIIAAARSLPT